MIGYFAAAFGISRVPLLRERWKETIVVATFASILLLLIFVSDLSLVGICLDTAILVIALVWEQQEIDDDVAAADATSGATSFPRASRPAIRTRTASSSEPAVRRSPETARRG